MNEDGFVPVVNLRRYNRRLAAQPGTDHPFALAFHPHDTITPSVNWFSALQDAELDDQDEDEGDDDTIYYSY